MKLHRQTHVRLRRGSVVGRRDFLRGISAASLAAGTLGWHDLLTSQAADLQNRGMACILLWMQGGPSQFETFSPKPRHANGGETKAISTSVPGIQIAEHLPNLAEVMDDVAIIRSMTSREGSHPRATSLLHTGYLPTASIKYPTFGSLVTQQITNEACELPSFVRVGNPGRNRTSAGFLGVDYDAFAVTRSGQPPANSRLGVGENRFRRRLNLLDQLQTSGTDGQSDGYVQDHLALYRKASKMILSPQMEAFDISKESQQVRESYGEGNFASGCLLARRLVESGVTFVEVVLNGWDTHQDNFTRVKELGGQIDQPMAQLIRDLKERGMLDSTLIIWMGEFGRTPKINARTGRDHFPRAFNVALAGGGVRGGQVIGATNAAGDEVTDRPVGVTDLFQSFCKSLKIDADAENMSSVGRPITVVDGGEPVNELFS
ncbi:MAG: DUF1501 domain-containing protein [Pirellulales bacterium]|nr:DUF1501 domain-containing protein [Pirellulales bacterium]